MKSYTASCCVALLSVSNSLPLLQVIAATEHEHKAAPVRSAPARPTPPRPAKEEQNNRRAEQQAERKIESQERSRPTQNPRAMEMQERGRATNNPRGLEMQERSGALNNPRGLETQERSGALNGPRALEMQEPPGALHNQRGTEMPERSATSMPESWHQNGPAAGGNFAHGSLPGQPGGPGNAFKPRPSVPPPFKGMRQVPLEQAAQMPTLPPNLNPAQQAAAQQAQQNIQQNLYAVSANQIPSNFQNIQSSQMASYLNNYPATVAGQPISITAANTYVNPMPQSSWPSWYQPTPGWGFTTGLVLGSVAAGLNWLRWGWPHYYGHPPAGFMYQTGYVPTPFIYIPWTNQWRQPGVTGYVPGPPPEYTGPITVEAIEPMQIMAASPAGVPIPESVNQVAMYNAFYNPRFGRWGYTNRNGYFIWVNPQPPVVNPVVTPMTEPYLPN